MHPNVFGYLFCAIILVFVGVFSKSNGGKLGFFYWLALIFNGFAAGALVLDHLLKLT